jgi:hypothetical protein
MLKKNNFTQFIFLYSFKAFENKFWKKNSSYKIKQETSDEIEPSDNVVFLEKDTIRISYDNSCLIELRDFLLDGTTIDLIEKKVFYYKLKFNSFMYFNFNNFPRCYIETKNLMK